MAILEANMYCDISVFMSTNEGLAVNSDCSHHLDTIHYTNVRKRAKIRNQYNQAPHLTQDTNGKVTTSQLDITNEGQEVSPLPADDYKAPINRRARKHNKNKT